ncbi:sodium- and chloride-dependent transporter XTRP3A-like [Argopecten irradians]|uniref:sodium- and chloride-dependent transporter XTRP3A-like n=1 Tax=Argopecten irradians TaxID=31199 RepID=UPI0037127B26
MTKKNVLEEEANGELTVPLNTDEIGANGKARAKWDSKLQYFFMVISYAVGLGNVWRFPYLVQQHGGGAFLIPYLIMLFVEGMPLLYLEFAAGQHFRMGSMGTWNKVHPFLGGVGIASAVTSFMVGVYYNAIIMWCFYYIFHSFQSPLPWATCPTEIKEGTNISVPIEECDISGPTSYFWYRNALDISGSIEESDGIKWKMLLCLIFAWLIIYACIWKGIKSSGKVVYVTATFPYVVLLIFFGRGITLKGATDGLIHMLSPKMDRLADPQVWLDAATQIFYSFGLGFGGLIAFSSYNPRNNNCERDAIIVSLTNWFTAILASTVIFSVLGFKATTMYENCVERNMEKLIEIYPEWNTTTLTMEVYKTTFENNETLMNSSLAHFRYCNFHDDLDKAAEGTGLAFIVFTQAINEFGPSAPFWSIIFFLMLLSLGIGSEFGTLEGVTTCIYDLESHPWLKKKWLVSGVLCFISCLIGILFVLGSGSYWVALFDSYAGSFPLISVALTEAIAIGWVYGVNRFGDDLETMIGHQPHMYWKVVWKFIAPFLIAGLLTSTLISKFVKPITYKAYDKNVAEMTDRFYPWFAGLMAAFLVLVSVLCIPGVAILRKFGILRYKDYAKGAQAQTGGHTTSTVAFMRTAAEDNDSGHNSDEINEDPERGTSCAVIDEHVTFGLGTDKDV